ncbi:hypothetical protein L228DRAFT_95868 [Xylona heveae TC161]|uniref:RING zinc finger-like domain-containing protein n=1 Tax=Xylona heveae (strain CBS 132557 / TC161) TaxID=1328760 RepID=A0A161TEN2_XYLHT|nr:hypothetical protein L228DRAFT_95868 [Xylona heveae TC161]KZF24407.1 hypothetical protein L228DRAFT_95868 [Xylona heveae TC161]
MQAMPPRSSLTSSFSVTDANNEVVCPLRNQDGSSCRKRCLGEKRYRSMQEHIRRAHPEHYIAKLPATEESFLLMINSPPSERPPQPVGASIRSSGAGRSKMAYEGDISSPATPRTSDEIYPSALLPAASAAAALAQLHTHRPDSDWESETEAQSDLEGNHSRLKLSPDFSRHEVRMFKDEPFHLSHKPRELLPSIIPRSPPGRSSTLPPLHRRDKHARPRKSSITSHARKAKHERTKSKEHARRMSYEGRKAYSAEPQGHALALGKRWEDLIDAAASATEAEDEQDSTPVPQSPLLISRGSMPPFSNSHFQSYVASPLQQALTPPPADPYIQPFPSVESSIDSTTQSGRNFHMQAHGLSDSSPTSPSQMVQIYCAACSRPSFLKQSYACTECICGICHDCVDVLLVQQSRDKISRCPRCGTVGGKFKPLQLDIR